MFSTTALGPCRTRLPAPHPRRSASLPASLAIGCGHARLPRTLQVQGISAAGPAKRDRRRRRPRPDGHDPNANHERRFDRFRGPVLRGDDVFGRHNRTNPTWTSGGFPIGTSPARSASILRPTATTASRRTATLRIVETAAGPTTTKSGTRCAHASPALEPFGGGAPPSFLERASVRRGGQGL